MKKLLLLMLLPALFLSLNVNAQDAVWDFGNDSTNWPEDADGEPANVVRENLGIFPGDGISNFAIIEPSPKTWEDGYSGENRFKFNGDGGADPTNNEFMPTKRYLYFAVDGDVTVDVWFRTGGSGSRTLYITDGTQVVGSLESDNTDPIKLSASYSGDATNLYIFGSSSCNLYKIEVTGDLGDTETLSTRSFNQVSTEVISVKNRVYVSNVTSPSEIKIYNLAGSLVKTVKTDQDMEFDLNVYTGVYIASITSDEGQKSSKIIIH